MRAALKALIPALALTGALLFAPAAGADDHGRYRYDSRGYSHGHGSSHGHGYYGGRYHAAPYRRYYRSYAPYYYAPYGYAAPPYYAAPPPYAYPPPVYGGPHFGIGLYFRF